MANLAQIQSIAQGQFFVKDSLGNLTELKVGDTVSLNDIIVAASSNTDLSKIEILFDTNELIILSQGEQLLDATLLASTFGNEELAFDKQEVDETLNAWNNAQDGDATDMETAAGDVTEQATNAGDERAADGGALRSKFNSRDGDATDIVSDLREASWTDGIERTIEDSENMLLEQPLPIVYTIIEGIDVVNEGDSANYVVKLQDAAGNPVIATQDTIIYVRYTNKTTQDGDTQYNNENIIEVVIKAGTSQTEFTIKTNDDYLADNGEIYNVSITGNNSTEFDMRTGDVAGNKTNVDTTILDNSNPLNPGGEDGGYGSEDIVFAIIEGTTAVKEGDTAQYVVKLVDKDGNPVTVTKDTEVTIKYTNKTTQDGDTQYKDNDTIKITIKAGENSSDKFDVDTIDDYLADNGEKFNLEITNVDDQGQFEKVNIGDINDDKKNVDTTILDNTTDKPNDPSTTETNGMEKVILKIVAVDKDGNPLFEVDGKTFKTTSEVVEGDSAYYKVFAFAPDSKEFNTDTKLPDILQGGTVTVKTGDIGAIGVQSQTANDGSQDYISKTQSDIKVGETIFTVKTIDDYKAETETNETFKVEIENGSYKHPNNDGKDAIYENVTIDPTVATTKIVDNNSTKNADVVVGGSDTNSTTYGAEDTVYAVITANKSSVAEGEVVTYTVKLVDYKGNEVKVSNPTDVTIKFSGSTTNPADLKDLLKINGIEVTDTTKDTFTIEIPKDKSSINFTIETKDDAYTEGKESYTLKIEDVNTEEFENIKFNEYTGLDTTKVPNPSNTTTTEINDNSTEVKIVLVAVGSATTTIEDITDSNGKLIYEDKNITPESGKLYYVAVAVDKDNNVLIQDGTVKVSTYDVAYGAKGGNSVKPPLDGSEDYQSLKDKEVSLGKVFDVQTNDDYVRDNNETFTVKIDSIVDGSKYENPSVDITRDTVTSTITDNDPTTNAPISENPTVDGQGYGKEDTVYVKIVGNAEVVEGGDLVHHIQLVDKDGKAVTIPAGESVTVTLTYKTNHDIKDSDFVNGSNQYNETTKTITVTIDKNTPKDENGIYKLPITNKTIDDFTSEGNEVYILTITNVVQKDSKFENIAIGNPNGGEKSVTGTIKDGVTLGTPKNAYVDEDKFYVNDLDGTNGGSTDITNISDKQSLGIIKNGETDFKLSFESDNSSNPIVTVQKGRPENGSNPSTLSKFEYKDGSTTLTSNGNEIKYKLVGADKIVAYIGTDANKNKVFEITLVKDNGKYTGDYEYTQYKNIDHPIDGDDKSINDDDITFEFGFKISDQGSTSSVQTFKVTVNDSTPIAGENTLTIYEDNNGKNKGAYTFVLSDEGFKENTLLISNGTEEKTLKQATYNKNGNIINPEESTIEIKDPNDSSIVIGHLTNEGNGKLKFKPLDDYSNYKDNPSFTYKVTDNDGDTATAKVEINIKPVADAPTIKFDTEKGKIVDSKFVVTTEEDNKNNDEGTHKVQLGLKTPYLSKDSDRVANSVDSITVGSGDKNDTATGDHPERNGEITLSFTNGGSLVSKAENKTIPNTGAKLFYTKDNGVITEIKDFLINSNKNLKVVIVETSGLKDIDTKYHYNGLTPNTNEKVVYLTKTEYESLQIQHAEDNDTDIAIKISVTSYEVDDNNTPLNKATYGNQVEKQTTANMIVKIQAVTDDITLNWDSTKVNANIGTLDNNVLKFNTIKENNQDPKAGNIETNELNFGSLLTPTSGAGTDTKLDLDGSEKRSYTIKLKAEAGTTLPDYIYITIGNQKDIKVNKDSNGNYKLDFSDANNKLVNPEFKIKFPDYWSGDVTGTITLRTKDYGVDNDADTTDYTTFGGEANGVKKAEVKFEAKVTPVANDVTVAIKQSFGLEDAGRDGTTGAVTTDSAKNGISLNIKVTSDDKDGSEKYNINLKEIPIGAKIYYNGVVIDENYTSDSKFTIDKSGSTWSVEIKDFKNDLDLKYIPEHNSNKDVTLKVDAWSIDGDSTGTKIADLDINVKVTGVADTPTHADTIEVKETDTDGNEHTYNKVIVEDTSSVYLKDLFTASKPNFTSLDIAGGDKSEKLFVTIKNVPVGFDIIGAKKVGDEWIVEADKFDNVQLTIPTNYSGEIKLNLALQTVEDDGDKSKVVDIPLSILVTPETNDGTVNNSATQNEDDQDTTLSFEYSNGGDTNETLEALQLDTNSIPDGVTITINGTAYTKTTAGENWIDIPKGATVTSSLSGAMEHKDTDYQFDIRYKLTDTTNDGSKFIKNTDWIKDTYKVTVNPITDETGSKIEIKDQTVGVTISKENDTNIVTVSKTGSTFKVPFTLTDIKDKDGSEKVTSITISGVPEGVTIEGATYKGDILEDVNGVARIINSGEWTLPANTTLDDISKLISTLTFKVDGEKVNFNDITTKGDITISVTHQDGSATPLTNSEKFKFVVDPNYDGTGGTIPNNTDKPMDLEITPKTAQLTEDNPFKLSELISVTDKPTTGDSSKFAILISNLPDGYSLSGATIQTKVIGGTTYYAILGEGDVAKVNELLNQITVTPKANENTLVVEKVDFNIDILTYNSEVDTKQNNYPVNGDGGNGGFDAELAPVSDETTITFTKNDVVESATPTEQDIKISLENLADLGRVEIVNGKVYVTFTETIKDKTGTEIGKLTYNGNPVDFGKAYEVDISTLDTKQELVFKYTPPANRYGELKIDTKITTQEKVSVGATDQDGNLYTTSPIESTNSTTLTITSVVSGVKVETGMFVGDEDGYATLDSSKITMIDDTETITKVSLGFVPTGYEVYYDGTKQSGELDGKVNGEYTYNYVISGTDLSKIQIKKIGVEDFSGVIKGVQLTLEVQEKDGSSKEQKIENLDVIFKPKADKLLNLTATKTFGNEYTWLDININANVKDTDGSEKLQVEFKAKAGSPVLDNTAIFKYVKDGVETSVNSEFKDGIWTIKDIPFDQINNIKMMYHDYNGEIDVKVKTVDSLTVGTETYTDTLSDTDASTSSFNLKIDSSSTITTGAEDNKIVTDGKQTIDAGAGYDTIILEANSTIDFNKLKNIEEIDLSKGNFDIKNIKLDDILKITDENNTLKITGDDKDKVSFAKNDGWQQKPGTTTDENGKTFTEWSNTTGDTTVTVKVEQPISDGITN